jgi:hypothetical protein
MGKPVFYVFFCNTDVFFKWNKINEQLIPTRRIVYYYLLNFKIAFISQ